MSFYEEGHTLSYESSLRILYGLYSITSKCARNDSLGRSGIQMPSDHLLSTTFSTYIF